MTNLINLSEFVEFEFELHIHFLQKCWSWSHETTLQKNVIVGVMRQPYNTNTKILSYSLLHTIQLNAVKKHNVPSNHVSKPPIILFYATFLYHHLIM
jgi:hypothetical protein